MSRVVTIFTGPVHTGKTTALRAWIDALTAGGTRVGGVLAPVVEGSRNLCAIGGACRRLDLVVSSDQDATKDPARVVTIGPHRFDGDVFRWARSELAGALTRRPDWVVVDEVGPLELRGEGLEPALGDALAAVRSADASPRVLLVVRDSLVARVVGHYKLGGALAAVVTTDSLSRIVIGP